MLKKLFLLSAFFLLPLLAGCGSEEPQPEEAPPAREVSVQTAAESHYAMKTVSYPGTINSEQEVVIAAKTAGTVADVSFELGDEVEADDLLARLEDSDNPVAVSFETAEDAVRNVQAQTREQVRIAELAVAQATTSRDLARSNFRNVQESTPKDLRQAEIAREQAAANAENIGVTTEEMLRSAEISYESAQIAALQARENLENQRTILGQRADDVRSNTQTMVTAARDNLESVLRGINAIFGFFDPDDIYNVDLLRFGSFETRTRGAATVAFQAAWETYIRFQKTEFPSLASEMNATLELAEQVKILVDAAKRLLENTNPGSVAQLAEYQTLINQYQNQVNSLLLQVQTGRQTFENIDLDTEAALNNLERATELAIQQEELARQNIENVRAGNISQTDQSSFGAEAAANQFEATRIRLESQLDASEAQAEIAGLQYQNALAALASARTARQNQLDSLEGQLELARIQHDNLEVSTPISGRVTAKNVVVGQQVAPGTPLATISQLGLLKVRFYVDAEYLPLIAQGQEVTITGNDDQQIKGAISAIAPEADAQTKRFLVEALPDPRAETENLLSGTVVSVEIGIRQKPQESGNFLLPLSALSVGQGEDFVYTIVEGMAKRTPVRIVNVSGDFAEIEIDIVPETPIVIEGNKLLQENEPVTISEDFAEDDGE